MSDIRQYLLFLGIFQMVGSAALFALLLAIGAWLTAVVRGRRTRSIATNTWHVFRKGARLKALDAADDEPSTWYGFLFATLFYYALPWWWWQWGVRAMLLLIALPIIAAILIGKFVIGAEDIGEGMLVSAAILIPLRVIAGFYVRRNHHRLKHAALQSRGWHLCGTVHAPSAALAKQTFAGQQKTAPSALAF